jgi:glycosyltransferase involved in cell wall biosynthesis
MGKEAKKNLFYSIIVPARNEAKYLSRTLKHLRSLDYPQDKYEVIIVESGSTDNTYSLAKKYQSKKIKVYHIDKKGVSVARNFGATKSFKNSDWLIFLDADTVLKDNFLSLLDDFLLNSDVNYSIGTMRMNPLEKSKKLVLVFKCYNLVLRLFKESYALQIVKKKFFDKVRYDEKLKLGEDSKLIKDMMKLGKFFFLNNDCAETSTRRFRQVGITKLLLLWGFGRLTPHKIKKNIDYKVVR